VDPLTITATGRLGAYPEPGTTSAGKPRVTLRLAVEIPPRTPGADSRTRWYKVIAFGTLATFAAESLHRGDRVSVRADDMTTEAWANDAGELRSTAVLWAYDIGPSLVFDSATTGRAAARAAVQMPAPAPVPAEEQANRRVLDGVTRQDA
jgi:single-stranded DNA-binding protein